MFFLIFPLTRNFFDDINKAIKKHRKEDFIMVDKTIPYKNIIMVADNLTEQKPTLSEGFYLDTYREGDEYDWAEMEVYAGDFSTVERGVGYFKSAYLLFLDS